MGKETTPTAKLCSWHHQEMYLEAVSNLVFHKQFLFLDFLCAFSSCVFSLAPRTGFNSAESY